MSHSGKPISQMCLDSLTDRFNDTLSCDKPDFKHIDLGSPVSPLRNRPTTALASASSAPPPPPTTTTTTTSSSSSSSSAGSVTGKSTNCNSLPKRSDAFASNVNGGEVSGSGSSESSPIASESTRSPAQSRNFRPRHARSKSAGAPLFFSGGGSSASSPNSPNLNALPTGNICPSGKILKTGMAHKSTSRSDVLGSGMGNYGHGSIMRGSSGAQLAGEGRQRAISGWDAEEVKRAGNEQYKRGNFGEALVLYDRAIALSPENAAFRSNRAAALTGLGRFGEAVRECEEAVRLDHGYGRAHQRLVALHLR